VGLASGHEEGGFVLREIDGLYTVRRWRRGAKDSIDVPPHLGCKYDDVDIAASFHTHPNTGIDYLQEPSETDKRAVRDDEDLKGEYYEGEFVISSELIYMVTPSGSVREIGETAEFCMGVRFEMAATLTKEVLQDEIAITLAQVIAKANKRASAAGVNVKESNISIAQLFGKEILWRINYGPREYISRRGGDFIVDVWAHNAVVKQVLRGQ
jgi:hypothetical protein